MLSCVLNSERAILVNIEIMRTFVRLRRILASHADLAERLELLEQKYETDEVVLALAAEKAELYQKFGMDEVPQFRLLLGL